MLMGSTFEKSDGVTLHLSSFLGHLTWRALLAH